jgi:hypothetical protein
MNRQRRPTPMSPASVMDVKDIIRPAETEATPSGARSARHKPGPAERARLAAQQRKHVMFKKVRTPWSHQTTMQGGRVVHESKPE